MSTHPLRKFPLVGLIIFIALGLIAGYIASFAVDYFGTIGHFATIISLSILFLVWTYVSKVKMHPLLFIYFVMMGLGTTVVASMLNDALQLTDALLQTLLFFGLFFVILILLAQAPKQAMPKR